jgi:hypothetical protein
MRCSVCGADNLEGSIYCEDCGARLPAASAAPVTQEASAVHPIAAPVAPSLPPVPTPAVTVAPAVAEASGANQNCGGCGAINPPGVAFCEDCGASLSETFPSIETAPTSQPVVYDAPTQVAAPIPVAVVAPVAQPVAATPTPRLVHSSGKEFPLIKDLILMGRRSPVDGIYPEVDLTELDVESYISRKHGRMVRSEQGFVFEDLGSSNGSFYNGARLQPNVQTPLKEGDSIRLGKTELFLRL